MVSISVYSMNWLWCMGDFCFYSSVEVLCVCLVEAGRGRIYAPLLALLEQFHQDAYTYFETQRKFNLNYWPGWIVILTGFNWMENSWF